MPEAAGVTTPKDIALLASPDGSAWFPTSLSLSPGLAWDLKLSQLMTAGVTDDDADQEAS